MAPNRDSVPALLDLAKVIDPLIEPAKSLVAELATRTGAPEEEVMIPPLTSKAAVAP